MLTCRKTMGWLCLIVGGLYVSTCNAIASDTDNSSSKLVSIAETAKKLNPSINSPFHENHPIVSLDGKTIFFSRVGRADNGRVNETHEDIWFANWNPNTGAWGKAQKFYHFNNSGANIINSLAIDKGTHTIVFGNDYAKTKLPTVELSYSKFEDKSWTEPRKFEIVTYNSYSKNDDHFVTEDGKVLLTSAILEAGKNDRNLYISERVTESMWSTPIPLKGVNTLGDDVAPYLLNGKYLFFATDGLGGYGGKDIFVVKRLSDTAWDQWSEPINLGPKVNTTADDTYFHYSKIRNSAYLIRGGEINQDILEINLHLEEEVFHHFEGEMACHARYFYQNEFIAKSNIAESGRCYNFRVTDINSNEVKGIDFLWDFGDHTADIGMQAKHCYKKAGNYHVDFYAKDSVHTYVFNDKYSLDLEVLDNVVLDVAAYQPEGKNYKTRVYTAKFDNLPEGTSVEYYWSFGDGDYDCAPTVSHEFLLEQSYQVQVTALFEFDGEAVQLTKSIEDNISSNS